MQHSKRNNELYERLLKEFCRLRNKPFNQAVYHSEYAAIIITNYIFQRVPSKELIKAFKDSKSTPPVVAMPDALDNEAIYLQTVKTLALMEASENMGEFEKLADKQNEREKKPEKELTDFDKILKGMMSVPKPNKYKTKKEDE